MFESLTTKSGDTIWYRVNQPFLLRDQIARIEFFKHLTRTKKENLTFEEIRQLECNSS